MVLQVTLTMAVALTVAVQYSGNGSGSGSWGERWSWSGSGIRKSSTVVKVLAVQKYQNLRFVLICNKQFLFLISNWNLHNLFYCNFTFQNYLIKFNYSGKRPRQGNCLLA